MPSNTLIPVDWCLYSHRDEKQKRKTTLRQGAQGSMWQLMKSDVRLRNILKPGLLPKVVTYTNSELIIAFSLCRKLELSSLDYGFSLTGARVEKVVPAPPVLSLTKMTKGHSVFLSDNMRSHDHIFNMIRGLPICEFVITNKC